MNYIDVLIVRVSEREILFLVKKLVVPNTRIYNGKGIFKTL